MNGAALEAFLARLYTDDALRARFLADPCGACAGAGLTGGEIEALARIDRDGLVLAARSFAAKRGGRERSPARGGWLRRLFGRR